MEIYIHKAIVEKATELSYFLHGDQEKYVQKIIDKSNRFIYKHNESNKVVIDATKKELGILSTFFKKVITKRLDFESCDDDCCPYKLIESTKFTEDLINSKLYLNRYSEWHNRRPLEHQINEAIKIETLRQFIEQNKSILIKNNII